MKVEPAHIDQIRVSDDGRVHVYDADAGTVAADLKALDAGLEVRFSERGECWIIQHVSHPGCPHNGDVGDHGRYLVTSVQATLGRTGVWTGLDQRVVDRFREIRPDSGYDYAKALEDKRKQREKHQRDRWHETVGEMSELAAHSLRRENGTPYKGRIFT